MTGIAVAASPYRGLAHFGDSELDELLFFGRERETEIVTANLIASRLTVVYGPSGVGKSSLVRAGVARRVRELGVRRAASRGPDLVCVVFGSWSGEDPLRELAATIGETVRPLVSPTALDPPPGSRLDDVVEHWSELLDGDICLVLDQVEESFVYADVRLLEELPPVVTRRGLRANVLLSVREDELARLGALKDRIPGVFANVRRLERLDRDAARAAILGPLARWNDLDPSAALDIEPELVDQVLADAASPDGSRIEAPYLQLLMERVWQEESARGSRILRASTLAELGGADAIVRGHLDHALESLALDQQEAAARMFGHLVTPSGTKIAHHASDLAAFAGLDEGEGRLLLEALGRERVLRPLDGEGDDARRYEIFHDVLAQAIVAWGSQRALVAERHAARRRQRRLLGVAIAAMVLAAVMVAVTVYALAQRSDARSGARHARASALVADSLAALPDDPRLSLLLAHEAAAADPTPQSTAALRAAFTADRARGLLRGQKRGVLAAGFAGGRVVTVDGEGTLRTFPARSAAPLGSLSLGGRVRAAAVAARGTSLVVARRRLVELHPLAAGRAFAFRTSSPVRSVAIDGDGNRVAVTTLDGSVSVHGGGPTATVSFGFAPTSVALDDDGRTVAVAGGSRVAVWRPRSRSRVVFDAGGDVSAVALSRDGKRLATAGADGALRIWSARTGALAAVAASPTQLTSVVFSPDGRAVIAGGADGTARVYDTAAGRPVSVLARHAGAVTAVAISRDGRLLVTGSRDGIARIWDPGVAPDLRVLARPSGCCAALATGPGGAFVAAGRRVLTYAGGRGIASWAEPARVTALAASGRVVVAGDVAGRVEARENGRPFLVRMLGGPVTAVASNGNLVAAAAGRRVVVFAADGRRLLAFDERRPVAGVALSPDGSLVATAGVDGIARVRERTTGRLVFRLSGHTKALTAIAFSPDGDELATSSYDHDVGLWDGRTGAMRKLLLAHFAVVSDVGFSPDGRWLVSAGPTTAGLWDAASGAFLAYLRGPGGRVMGAGFVDGGRTVVAASRDGTVRDYRCDICGTTADLLGLATKRLAATGDALTPAERRLYPSP